MNRNFKVTRRTNRDADCMTIFNHPERNEVECLTHKNPKMYKHFPKFQVVGVWKIKSSFNLIHSSTGIVGCFVKEYRPTGGMMTTKIRMENGDIYFAPSVEFKINTLI